MNDPFNAFVPYPFVPVPNASDGPLAGLTLGVKDIFDVAGWRTGCGSPTKLAGAEPAAVSAPAVQRLLDAGARLVGKTQTDEIAWSLTGLAVHFAPPINPAAPDRITGGSSTGSAVAVAGGLCDVALGSDTGGSVRAPASFCGIWGLRPTWGRVPLDGVMPLVPSFDTAGLFARNGETLLRAAEALLGPDQAPLAAEDAPRAAADMLALCAPAARDALAPAWRATAGEAVALFVEDADALHDVFDVIQAREVVATHGPWIEARRPPLNPLALMRYAHAKTVSAEAETKARAARARITAAFDARLDGRAVLAPTVPDAPMRRDADAETAYAFSAAARRLLCVAGIAGLPQVAFPAARVGGAPVGLSLIGPRGTDLALVRAALALSRRLAPVTETA
jgi:amidase